ncbi:SAM-dependent DNA methyltransferase [Rhodococcus sp. D2-41]|uniref:site-specific DNA-methyltransferase (adenine-specific) n=1 Tax=Speluncibacter jeojiensis TaxID=2710754 RepID=A0A9X4LYL2_9ACTN|nr:class I SAM-dependent DNA methyltransferase [Rhodococcus sp. D2-41]MDG3012271.1 SAM-dependent DNA methyltransferase [Rhodococcus sp. D2-41]MDG3014758.1 type I restriction-modification system subunit M [Corynebacteriales bacterium D3-21]
MPPRKKTAEQAPSTMKELKDTLWKAADKLRGSMDASQYKDVILGLVFLKYVSDAFEERRGQIRDELLADGIGEDQVADFLDDKDEYLGNGVFWVPPLARWSYLAANAKGVQASEQTPGVTAGELVDQAMREIMAGNRSALEGTLPMIYNRDSVDQRRLGELIDLLGDTRFTGHGATRARDLLGEVYEYFLEKFARAEGKRGGEFYTPAGVVRVLVEMLEPFEGRVYDPCCGSGGMFVQTEKFIERHGGNATEVSVYGQELNERTWRMAKMNLAIHGINGNLADRWEDTFARDKHPDLLADFVLANPPFNIKDWARKEDDSRWRFGVPPAGNANYAWIQHIVSKLSARGSAGIVMANGSMSSNSGGEGQIRAQLVEADLVSCMIALPTQLFRSTGIPVCVWFLSKDKAKGPKGSVDRQGQVLFIDARDLGHMVDRAERALSDEDIAKIAGTFHAWRGTQSAAGAEYVDEPGFCYSATLPEIKEADYALTPGRYVGAAPIEDDGEPIEEKLERLTKELYAQFDESERLAKVVREQLGRVL